MTNSDEEKPNFTFAGCGFLGIYHVGVASCLREYAPPDTIQHLIGGASAGAMVAALLLCEAPLGYCTSWTLKLAAKARKRSLGPMHPSFSITDHLKSGLEEILPSNAHEICTNKLHVSMTRVRDGKNVIISEFQTRADLIQVLLCSAYIPLWSGFIPPIYKGERYVDGALSNNLPRINKYTITVSPFAGHSDICPKNESPNIHYWLISNTSFQFTIKNLYRLSRIMFPPHPEKLSQICKQGFEDALSYLKENHMVNCSRHLAIRSVLSRSVSTSFSDDGEEAEDEHDGCEHCTANRMKDRELHPSVITALEDAVNVVNSNYMLYMKNLRSYRTFSVLCSPLYLPFDVTVATFSKMLKWLPSIHHDAAWLAATIVWYAKLLSGKVITKGKHTYTAKFVCQFAITEVQHTDVASDMVMTSRARIRDQRFGFDLGLSTAENIEYVQSLREKYLDSKELDSLDVKETLPNGELLHTSFSPRHSQCCSRITSPAPSRRGSLVEGDAPAEDDQQLISSSQCSQYLDTFDQCVEVVEHTEAVLAYYYKDEEGQLKTTEIFKLEDSEASVDPTPSPSELVSALAAKKLRHHGSTRSVISAVSMEDGASPDICPSPS